MKLKIYLHQGQAVRTAYVKLSRGESFNEEEIKRCVETKYGRNTQYVIFDESGEIQGYAFYTMAVGDIGSIIKSTPEENYRIVDLDS